MEERVAELETLVDNHAAVTNGSDSRPLHSLDATRFVGPESGINFIQPIVDAMRRQGHPSPQRQELLIEFRAPYSLPTQDIARRVVGEYFREFHVGHPILDQAQITTVVEKIYGNFADYNAPTIRLSRSQRHDLFQLNMVLAIGSIQLSRNSLVSFHPFGFFTAALEADPPSDYRFCAIEDVENLLLIALFGLFYNIGCSIWELGRLCVRICIELRLYCRQGNSFALSDAEVDRCRRVFWESYLLDRFSSSMLGRPYAIDDAVIEIDVSDQLYSDPFSHLVRMGRITSEMHAAIFYPETERVDNYLQAKHTGSSNLLSTLRNFHGKLKSWRLQVPLFEHQTCVYETPEFFEMTFQESRLWLFRAVINKLPPELTSVREKLLLLCLQAAQKIIVCFNTLWQKGSATFSRSSTRLILISGLVTISVFKMQVYHRPGREEEDNVSDVDIDFWLEDLGLDTFAQFPTVPAFRETIGTARRILSGLAIQMPDVTAYAHFFALLEGEMEKAHQNRLSAIGSARDLVINDPIRINERGLGSAVVESAPLSSRTEQCSSYELAQQNEDINQSVPGLHEQPDLGNTALDDFLSNMYQTEHVSNNNDGVLLGNDAFWSFPHAPWMGEIDDDISGFIWDTAMPWQGSPFANT